MLSKNYIKKIVTRYLHSLPVKVKFGILFGSSAYGERLRESDIDVIVISDDFKDMPFEDRMLILQKNWNYNADLEAFAFTTDEFNKLKNKSIVVTEADEKGTKIHITQNKT